MIFINKLDHDALLREKIEQNNTTDTNDSMIKEGLIFKLIKIEKLI